MIDDGIQDKVQKAQQSGIDFISMSNELNKEREAIYDNILTSDIRPAITRLAEINSQLEVISGLHRHHANRLKEFMAGLRSAVN